MMVRARHRASDRIVAEDIMWQVDRQSPEDVVLKLGWGMRTGLGLG